jgi:hypothetical protein
MEGRCDQIRQTRFQLTLVESGAATRSRLVPRVLQPRAFSTRESARPPPTLATRYVSGEGSVKTSRETGGWTGFRGELTLDVTANSDCRG